MIVRTSPAVLPNPDAMRAMERLEAQLRRAADDLAETLAQMRAVAAEPVVTIEFAEDSGRRPLCNQWMPVARVACARGSGHRGACRSRETMDDEAVRRAKGRAA